MIISSTFKIVNSGMSADFLVYFYLEYYGWEI